MLFIFHVFLIVDLMRLTKNERKKEKKKEKKRKEKKRKEKKRKEKKISSL